MTRIDPEMEDTLIRYHKALVEHEGTIRNALAVHAERMGEAAQEARAAYEAGQSDPALKARQDRTFMTNNGCKQAAEMLLQSAEAASRALEDIRNAIGASGS